MLPFYWSFSSDFMAVNGLKKRKEKRKKKKRKKEKKSIPTDP